MEILKTTGIVLYSRIYGEGDITGTIFTKEHGKRKFIFKGLKKSKRRSKSATEPGSITKLVYYFHEEKKSYIVSEFSLHKYYSSIMNSLQKIYHLCYLLESVDKTNGYNVRDNAVYELLLGGIDTLSKTEHLFNLSSFFILHLLRIHGILPDFKACKFCGGNSFNEFSLDINDLKPICERCVSAGNHSRRRENIILNRNAKEFISASLHHKFNSINHEEYNKKEIMDIIFNLSLFIENYYHTEIKSKRFILSY